MSLDAEGFAELAADLDSMGRHIQSKVRPVVTRGAGNVQRDWRGAAGRSRHFKMVPFIGFDVEEGTNYVEAEIGPSKAGAGNLANIAHFGGANGGGGTLPDPTTFMDNEEASLLAWLSDVAGEVL